MILAEQCLRLARRWRWAAWLLLISCMASRTLGTLPQQIDTFHLHLRWKRLPEAAAYVAPDKRAEFFQAYRGRLERLAIDELEITAIEHPRPGEPGFADPPTLATVRLIRYETELPDVTRRKVELTERWMVLNGRWHLMAGFD